MTVQELIDELLEIKLKDRQLTVYRDDDECFYPIEIKSIQLDTRRNKVILSSEIVAE